jgi:hypothetical protein
MFRWAYPSIAEATTPLGRVLIMTDPIAVSVEEAKRHLGGVSTATVYRLMDRNELQKRKVGSRTLITMASIRALLQAEAA